MVRPTKPLPGQSGIYAIRNQRTGTVYVGSTRDLRQRWSMHRCDLRAGRHHSASLQAAWLADGESVFVLEMLEEMPNPVAGTALNKAEEAWYDQMIASGTPLYNRWFHPRAEHTFGPNSRKSATISLSRDLVTRIQILGQEEGRNVPWTIKHLLRYYEEHRTVDADRDLQRLTLRLQAETNPSCS